MDKQQLNKEKTRLEEDLAKAKANEKKLKQDL